MNRKLSFKSMEWSILICVVVLIAIGCVALYSATQNTGYDELKKQLIWLAISIPVMIIFVVVDYELIIKSSPVVYTIMLALLVAVLFTKPINGATSWYNIGAVSFQPSEFAKICVILSLSNVIVRIQGDERKNINRPFNLLRAIIVFAIPVLLIVIQPDYGTAIAFCLASAIILIVSGLDKKYIITAILSIVIVLPLLYFFVLPAHAKTRIDVFLNPNLDPRGSGYNVLQSKLAIGSGKFGGMGIKKGGQTQLGYLYPQTTDFIYSAIGEEMGFFIAGTVIILYVVLIMKAIKIAKTSKDDLGAYIAAGIAGIFIFHMTENIGMTMGLLPITGVPLPFVSYGGSSLLTNCILIGLLLNISGRRNKIMFGE